MDVQLPAALTLRDAGATLKSLAAAIAGGDAVRVDASALRQFDTSAIAVLLECRRLALHAGRELRFTALPAPLLELARLYGADVLLAEGVDGDASSSPAARAGASA